MTYYYLNAPKACERHVNDRRHLIENSPRHCNEEDDVLQRGGVRANVIKLSVVIENKGISLRQ